MNTTMPSVHQLLQQWGTRYTACQSTTIRLRPRDFSEEWVWWRIDCVRNRSNATYLVTTLWHSSAVMSAFSCPCLQPSLLLSAWCAGSVRSHTLHKHVKGVASRLQCVYVTPCEYLFSLSVLFPCYSSLRFMHCSLRLVGSIRHAQADSTMFCIPLGCYNIPYVGVCDCMPLVPEYYHCLMQLRHLLDP